MSSRINVMHDEEVQWYVHTGHSMTLNSGLGEMLEAARDNVSLGGGSVDFWRILDSASDNRALRKARAVAVQLWGAELLYTGAIAVLWAYCHPTTVTTCDGLYGSTGRLLAVYPLTQHARKATDKRGRLLVRRVEKNPTDSLRQLNADRVQAKGQDVLKKWSRIREEALLMRQSAFDAYATARRAVQAHYREFHCPPMRDDLPKEMGL